MIQRLKNVKIKKLLWISYIVLMLELALTSVYLVFALKNTTSASKTLYENYGTIQGEIGMAYSQLVDVKVELRNVLYLYAEDPQKQSMSIDALNENRTSLMATLESVSQRLLDKDSLNYCNETITNANAYLDSVDECIKYVKANNLVAARATLLGNGVASANNAETSILALIDSLNNHADTYFNKMSRTNLTKMNTVVSFIVIYIIVSILIATVVVKLITNPISRLTSAAKALAVGNVDVTVSKEGKNELGIMMECFSDMVDNIKYQAGIIAQVANGNLRVDVKAQSEDDVIGNALVKLVNDTNTILSSINEAGIQVSTGSNQVAMASQSLAQSSTEQASAIEEISSSVTDIAEKTSLNAEKAQKAHDLVLTANNSIASGKKQMEEMITAMHEINISSENIYKIIKVIDDIAFQTNILALNAAVEAARAGEQGKGFAVVAEEVRSLAAKSATAASETAQLIEDSISKASKGVKLADATANGLSVVSDSIEQAVSLISTISDASKEQATATVQIDQALSQVANVTQSNSATSEECAAASDELSNQSSKLKELIQNYKLKTV